MKNTKRAIGYQGLFFDEEETRVLFEHEPVHLERKIQNPHITFYFAVSGMELKNYDDELQKKISVVVTGYGNDGSNSGFRVELPKEFASLYKSDATPHITMSLARGAWAVNTKNIKFEELDHPFMVTGILKTIRF